MITASVYVFLVHVIVCATVEGRVTSNHTRKSLVIQNNTQQINAFASNETNKECRLTINETDLSFLQQLAQSRIVHVVELDLHFASNISNSVIEKWRWRMTNNVGKEILSVLALQYTYVTWTLEVGKKAAKVNILDEPSGCITFEKAPGDLIAAVILKQVSVTADKEICFDVVSNISTQTRCCKIFARKDPLKNRCYVRHSESEFVNVVKSMLSVYEYCVVFGGLFLVLYFGVYLQVKNTSNTNYRFYKLTESPVSISSVLSMLFWDGYGKFKSFVRKCVLVVLLLLLFFQTKKFKSYFVVIHFSLWAILFPFFNLYEISPTANVEAIQFDFLGCRRLLKLFSYLGHGIQDVFLSAKINTLGAINLITLPFNIKRWRKSLAYITPNILGFSLKDKVLLYVKTGVFWLFHIILVFTLQVIFIWLFASCSYGFILFKRVYVLNDTSNRWQRFGVWLRIIFFEGFCFSSVFYFLLLTLQNAPSIAFSLLSGLFLNIVYFLPYAVYVSIIIFYSWLFWTSVEQRYVVLMRLIFDHNLNSNEDDDVSGNNSSRNNNNSRNSDNNERSNNNNNISRERNNNSSSNGNTNCNRNSDSNRINNNNNSYSNNGSDDNGTCENTEIVCVVSKELYDDVRERLLPYHGVLFCYVMKAFGVSLFAYITLTLVRILQANDVSPTVQLLTTFSVSAFPYIMNTVAAKKGEEQNDNWKEQLKRRVKLLVDELTADNPGLRQTQLVVRHEFGPNTEELRETRV